jgi:hypothetical protein
MQLAVMWFVEQAPPMHAPQWLASVLRLTSQPLLFLFMSQSAKPLTQVPLQTPPLQVTVAMLFVEQAPLTHAPQCMGSLPMSASQPLARMPSQLPKLGLHEMPQAPATHVGVLLGYEAQIVPHMLQLVGLVLTLVSQPLPSMVSQLPKPALHETPQAPAVHVAVPLA